MQDSILAEPKYNQLVEIIDTKYWRYEAGGKLYAPPGGVSLAPRQHLRLKQQKILITKGNPQSDKAAKATQNDDVQYWTVRDYRTQYPEKAVIFSSDVASVGWPAFMAGGSVCSLPGNLPKAFLKTAVKLQPMDAVDPTRCWLLGRASVSYILFVKNKGTAELDLTGINTTFNAQWIDAGDGNTLDKAFRITGGRVVSLPAKSQTILWLYK